jgi:hypothetical protein
MDIPTAAAADAAAVVFKNSLLEIDICPPYVQFIASSQ